MASTPSPAADLPSTPPAPRYGNYHDDWEPYQPRKSPRLSSQPKPPKTKSASPPATKLKGKINNTAHNSRTRINSARVNSTRIADDMLPTPTKSPRKTAMEKKEADVDAVSRDIFRSTNRSTRVPKKISGSTLESFKSEDVDQDFAIYNDTCNRIPQKDDSNPFFNPTPCKQKKRSSESKRVRVPGHGSYSIEEAVHRDDGMLFNFRGKTFYRHFAKPGNCDSEELDELATDVGDDIPSRPSPKQFKPKLLWPKNATGEDDVINDDEEAATDVEDTTLGATDSPPTTPIRKGKTPNAPRFLASPPTTQRTTRSMDKLGDQPTPIEGTRRAQPVLNYNKWGSVAKTHKSNTVSAKRSGEPLPQNRAKRPRAPNSVGH